MFVTVTSARTRNGYSAENDRFSVVTHGQTNSSPCASAGIEGRAFAESKALKKHPASHTSCACSTPSAGSTCFSASTKPFQSFVPSGMELSLRTDTLVHTVKQRSGVISSRVNRVFIIFSRANRVAGGATSPSSHTTGLTGPYPAVPKSIMFSSYLFRA